MSPHEILRDATWAIGKFFHPNVPARLLEIGPAWGVYGMILRNFCEAWFGRFEPEDFAHTIDAIEASEIEVGTLTRRFYDNIIIGDAMDCLPAIKSNSYNVAYAIEVIEHLSEVQGEELVRQLLRVAKDGVVISTPHPESWVAQGEVHGNPYEKHKSVWHPDKLKELGFSIIDNRPCYVAYQAVKKRVAIGVITFNSLDIVKRCYPSWRAVPNAVLVVLDNGSDDDTIQWLRSKNIDSLLLNERNMGTASGRNRLIRYIREKFPDVEWSLLCDSDIELHDGMIDPMVEAGNSDGKIGMVGYPQGNKAFPVSEDGYLDEIAGECALYRMEMTKDLQFPERMIYYSSDSFYATIMRSIGWITKLVTNNGDGYTHYEHSSQSNPGVIEQKERDTSLWCQIEESMEMYWKLRIKHGKANIDTIKNMVQ